MKKELKLNITGMHCTSCEKILTEELGDLKGVEKAEVSYENKNATVVFNDDKVTRENSGSNFKRRI